MRSGLALLLAAALLLPLAAAQPTAEAEQIANGTVQKSKSLVDEAVEGLSAAATGAGEAAGSAANGAGQAAAAVGRFLAAVAGAIADGVVAAGGFVAEAAAAVALGEAAAVTASVAWDGLGQTFAALADAARWAGAAVARAAVALGSLVAALATLYGGFVAGMRPRAMDPALFQALAATGAAASAGAAGYGLWGLLRRFAWLAGIPGVAGFSRIEDGEVLRHPLRSQVFQVIQASPGIHASELTRRVGTGWGTIVHHLDRLERAKLVTVRRVNNQKCYFEAGGKVSRQDMAVASAVRSDSASQIAAFVASHPMTNQKEMAAELGISPALASFHVKKLVALGVLDKVRQGKATLLTTTDALRRVLAGESAAVAPPVLVQAQV
jgi:DNA-binding MarR family transcriptional regulator